MTDEQREHLKQAVAVRTRLQVLIEIQALIDSQPNREQLVAVQAWATVQQEEVMGMLLQLDAQQNMLVARMRNQLEGKGN